MNGFSGSMKGDDLHIFKPHLNQLKEQHPESNYIFDLISFEDSTLKFTLKCSTIITPSKISTTKQPMQLLNNLLVLFKSLNFTGLYRFKIELIEFNEVIEPTLLNSILNNLMSLQNLQNLEINQEQSNQRQSNISSFFLFSSFELPISIKRYQYSYKSKANSTIYITQEHRKQKLHYQFSAITFSFDSQAPPTLPIFFRKYLDFSVSHRSKFEEDFPFNKQSMQMKQYELKFYDSTLSLFQRIIYLKDLLKLWDLDSYRVSKVYLKLPTEQMDLNPFNQYENHNHQLIPAIQREFHSLNQIDIFSKVHFEMNCFIPESADHLIELMKYVKKVSFQLSNRSINYKESLEYLRNKIEQNSQIEPNKFGLNLNAINYSIHSQYQLGYLEDLPSFFPSLKKVKIDYKFKNTSSLHQVLRQITPYLKQLTYFKFGDFILFQDNEFVLRFSTQVKDNNFEEIIESAQIAIRALAKPITFKFQLNNTDLDNQLQRNLLLAIRKFLAIPTIFPFKFQSLFQEAPFQTLIKERNSLYLSIFAYMKNLSSEMVYSPGIILFDMYDSLES